MAEIRIERGLSDERLAVGKGDLAVFPRGMSCTWDVRAPLKKHYNFD